MSDQILRVRDNTSVVRDIARQNSDGSWAINVGGEISLTTAQINVLAKDATMLAILAQLDDLTSDTVLSVLKAILSKYPSINGDGGLLVHLQNPIDISILSTEATLLAIKNRFPSALDADGGVKSHVQNFPIDGAKEATIQRRFGSGKTVAAQRVSSSGDNTLLTPASGKFLRLYWVGMSTPEANGSEMLVVLKFGSSVKYRWNMTAPGAFSHWDVIEGAVDQSFVANLGAAKNLDVNLTYEEI